MLKYFDISPGSRGRGAGLGEYRSHETLWPCEPYETLQSGFEPQGLMEHHHTWGFVTPWHDAEPLYDQN